MLPRPLLSLIFVFYTYNSRKQLITIARINQNKIIARDYTIFPTLIKRDMYFIIVHCEFHRNAITKIKRKKKKNSKLYVMRDTHEYYKLNKILNRNSQKDSNKSLIICTNATS